LRKLSCFVLGLKRLMNWAEPLGRPYHGELGHFLNAKPASGTKGGLVREVEFLRERDESRIGAQGIELRLNFQEDQAVGAIYKGVF